MSGGVVAFEGELNNIVREYLDYGRYEKTFAAFEYECSEKGKAIPQSDGRSKSARKPSAIQNQLLRLLEDGDGKSFFRVWNRNLPENIRNNDSVAQKLEFYVNIFFAIYPLKYSKGDPEEGMNNFKVFLETRGSTLSQTTEFLPFYALPFVPNPRKHPSYKELFAEGEEEKWVPDLKSRLEKFLSLTLASQAQPKLFELYKGGPSKANDFSTLEHKTVESEKKAAAYYKRYNRMQADYHNLISITADLVDSLENTVQGKPVSPEYLQHICMRLFSNQVRQSVDFTRPGTAGEVLRQSVAPPQGLQHNETSPGSVLDYNKIKKDLISAAEKPKGLLLQALRWKLTKSTPAERETMLSAYISNDILGCTTAGSYRTSIMELLSSGSKLVEQYTARLFNAVASLCEGRSYLGRNPDLLKALIDNLKSDQRDSITRENVLGSIQKLSLRRHSQSVMIEEGIIYWLVSMLEDNDSLSDYLLEYSVALLMNLCLRTAGKNKCMEDAHKVLKVLSDLLGHENQEIIPYVNGTLYSILALPPIREEAKAMGMEEMLSCFIKEDQPDMNRQIEFIIKQLNSNEDPDDAESDDEDEDEDEEDQDAIEADLDKAEMLKSKGAELSGDRLLNTHYVSTQPSAGRRKKATDAVSNQEDLLRRPVTPSHMKGGESPVVHVQPRSRPLTGGDASVLISESQYIYSCDFEPESPRPPTGKKSSRPGSRNGSRDNINRPPTRSGSRPNTQEDMPSRPASVESDRHGSDIVSKATGSAKKLAVATENKGVKPSKKSKDKNSNVDTEEYEAAFGTRPRITRTAEGRRPTSRGSVGDGPTPQPKYSDSLPTPRPGSGGRPAIKRRLGSAPARRHPELAPVLELPEVNPPVAAKCDKHPRVSLSLIQ